jgi:hypothetical protein
MVRAILRVLSSSRLMSFLVAILADVGGNYYCWLNSGRLLVQKKVVAVVLVVIGGGILHGCL